MSDAGHPERRSASLADGGDHAPARGGAQVGARTVLPGASGFVRSVTPAYDAAAMDASPTARRARTSAVTRVGADEATWRGRPFAGFRPVVAFGLVALLATLAHVGLASAQVTDPRFPEVSGAVRAFATSGDTLYFGGDFQWVGEHTGAAALLDPATNTHDPSWRVIDGNFPTVRAIAADGEGGWYIGGDFTDVAGRYCPHLVHIRSDRSIAEWQPNPQMFVNAIVPHDTLLLVAGGFETVFDEHRQGFAAFDRRTGALLRHFDMVDDWGYAAALAVNDSLVFLGGGFSEVGGEMRSRLAAINLATGHVTGWDPGVGVGGVNALALADSVLYVGGDFTTVRGVPRRCLAAFDVRSGELLPWNPGATMSTTGATSSVKALALLPGQLVVGGQFEWLGDQPRHDLGSVDPATGVPTSWNPNLDSGVECLASNGSRLWVGGWFQHVGAADRPYLAEFDVATGALTTWQPRPSDAVYALAPDGERVFVGGRFRAALTGRRYGLAAIDLVTNRLTSWAPVTGGSIGGSIHALAAARGTVYAGGTFSIPGSNLAAYDAVSGAVRPSWPFVDRSVNALAVRDSCLYVGGWFTRVGYTSRRGIAELNASTGALTAWAPDVHGPVQALAISGDRLFVGGDFDSAGGQPRSRLAAFDRASRTLAPWDPGASSTVYALAAAGPLVYAAGEFGSVGGQIRWRAAALDGTTGVPTAWNPMAYGTVRSIAPAGDDVWVGGYIWTVGGVAQRSIAKLDSATGSTKAWSAFDAPVNVNVVLPRGDRVLVGGDYAKIAGLDRLCLAAVGADGPRPMSVALLDPNEGGAFSVGDTAHVRWQASGGRGIESIDVLLAREGPGGPWEKLGVGVPNTGEFAWRVTGPVASMASLRIDAWDYVGAVAADVADLPFSIGPVLSVPTPGAAGAAWLGAPFPSPARGGARVHFVLAKGGRTRLSLFDVQGREVRRFADGERRAGRHTEALDFSGLEAGLYFVQVRCGRWGATTRTVVLR